ncbi:basic membrane protein A [Mycoplasmoides fastidiosum]|uniref:Basic membrane protein A n=1 Tax=Mycoplasmoides fastidiosum TaxID=92758 RepID=A0ABU0M026_9BACT|nr:hypothetical protein [Mycoplasmoides fastidiosum]MDQ0514314.1 basic membrane protein A [Mycoplasmoides fastidiosum]UUD38082.1 hypothetical protein NPA10_01665 [Mycoplasmoides fastidiosum]
MITPKKSQKAQWKICATSFCFSMIGSMVLTACGSGAPVVATTDVARLQDFIDRQNPVFETAKQAKQIQDWPVTLITASGQIQDNSFNQSLWEAVSKVSVQAGITPGTYQETFEDTNLASQYQLALRNNKKIWVLSGFTQGAILSNWLKIPANRQAFIDKQVIVIGVDWAPDPEVVPPGQGIELLYRTEESGFMVGYATAGYLSKKYPTDPTKRIVSAFGGAADAGVTSFLAGWLGGIGFWNNTNETTGFSNKADNQPVKFNDNSIILNTAFIENNSIRAQINALVNHNHPQIILPVAGVLTGTTLEATKNSDQLVVGVDTDQSLAYPQYQNKFFSSIEKRLGYTTYKILSELLLNKANTSAFLQQDSANRFNLVGSMQPSNVILNKGFDDEYVSYAASTLADPTDRAIANDALKAAAELFAKHSSKPTVHIPDVKLAEIYGSLNIPDVSIDTNNQMILNAYIRNYINQNQSTPVQKPK